MKILICGGRNYDPAMVIIKLSKDNFLENIIRDEFDLAWEDYKNDITIIQGGAKGADLGGKQFADYFGFNIEEYKADWKKYGKAAGPIRNKQMIDEGKPDLVIAFPGGSGTMNMIKQAKDAYIPVYKVGE